MRWRLSVLLLALAVTGCGSSGSPGGSPNAPSGPGLQGLILKPAKPAPALVLHNYTGQTVSLTALRGHAAFVTFVYTHCPDVCPLMVAALATAQRNLGRQASQVRIIAVTVDPRRDTPAAIKQFLAARDGIGRMYYLIGSQRQLLKIWKAWDVGVTVDTKHVIAGHSAVVYGITASGRMAVVYPSDFTPAEIVHDVPLLAKS